MISERISDDIPPHMTNLNITPFTQLLPTRVCFTNAGKTIIINKAGKNVGIDFLLFRRN